MRSAPFGLDPARASAAALILWLAFTPVTGARAGESVGWYPTAGAHWVRPSDGGVRDLYSGGPGLSAGMGYLWNSRTRMELRADWFRQSGHPLSSPLTPGAESRLTFTPVTAEGHVRFHLRQGTWPFLAGGAAMVFSEERFRYALLGVPNTLTGRRTNFGGILGAGVELVRDAVTFRLSARALLVGGGREVLMANGRRLPGPGDASSSLVTLGCEVLLR